MNVRRVRWGARRIACLVAAIAATALGFLPLFGGPGYEIALAYGVLLPSMAAIASARPEHAATPLRGLWDGIVTGASVFTVGLAISFLHLLHAPLCDPFAGAGYMLLTAGLGTLLGGLWGGAIRELARPSIQRRRALRVLAALSAPVGGALISLWRFYRSPMIFAYDPFAGYFSGTLYDTVVEPGRTLWLYRAGSCCTLLGVLLVALVCVRDAARPAALPRIVWRGASTERRALSALGALLLLLSTCFWLYGDRLDVNHDATSIARGLGARLDGARCSVIAPSSLESRELSLLLRDCEEQLLDVERVLGARGPERVTAFFFRDSAEKKRYMGAANTYIAKPWRHEVYLQIGAYPHPVLGHELAHVVAGSFGQGPFRIAGRLHGLLPDPGLIEGIATAASPDDDALTDLEWCKAMKDENLLPQVASLFSLSFLGHASSRAYTVAGAFVGYVRDRFGAEVVRAWYAGGDLEQLTARSWPALEDEFHAHLDALPMSAASREYARAKFGKPGVFGRRCPHLVDRLRGEGQACVRDHDYDAAARAYADAQRVDANDPRVKLDLAALAAARGELGDARARYEVLMADGSAQVRERAREQLGDLLLLQGDYAAAEALFEAIGRETEDEDIARSSEVKRLAAHDPWLRGAVVTFLVGVAPQGQKAPLLAGALLAEARSTSSRNGALVSYLLGKNLNGQGLYEQAMPWLRTAAQASDLGARVRRELLRQLVIAACLTDADDVLQETTLELEHTEASGRTASILRLARRCRLTR